MEHLLKEHARELPWLSADGCAPSENRERCGSLSRDGREDGPATAEAGLRPSDSRGAAVPTDPSNTTHTRSWWLKRRSGYGLGAAGSCVVVRLFRQRYFFPQGFIAQDAGDQRGVHGVAGAVGYDLAQDRLAQQG